MVSKIVRIHALGTMNAHNKYNRNSLSYFVKYLARRKFQVGGGARAKVRMSAKLLKSSSGDHEHPCQIFMSIWPAVEFLTLGQRPVSTATPEQECILICCLKALYCRFSSVYTHSGLLWDKLQQHPVGHYQMCLGGVYCSVSTCR